MYKMPIIDKDIELFARFKVAESKKNAKQQKNLCDYKAEVFPDNIADISHCRLVQKNMESQAEQLKANYEAIRKRNKFY